MNDLARRLVQLPTFRWMPGMANPWGERVLAVHPDEDGEDTTCPWDNPSILIWRADEHAPRWLMLPTIPDLRDPVTLAAVGELACEALGVDVIDVRVDVHGSGRAWWTARSLRGHRHASGTFPAALGMVRPTAYVEALEYAATQRGE
jgi:hypothetical protein